MDFLEPKMDKKIEENSEIYLKGLRQGIKIAYQDVIDLIQERMRKHELRK